MELSIRHRYGLALRLDFYEAKLYSDAGLQIFFFVVQFYGWYYWLKGRGDDGLVIVQRLTRNQALGYAGAGIAGIGSLGTIMAQFTDASFPYWDASIAVLSVIAQILLARRRLETGWSGLASIYSRSDYIGQRICSLLPRSILCFLFWRR